MARRYRRGRRRQSDWPVWELAVIIGALLFLSGVSFQSYLVYFLVIVFFVVFGLLFVRLIFTSNGADSRRGSADRYAESVFKGNTYDVPVQHERDRVYSKQDSVENEWDARRSAAANSTESDDPPKHWSLDLLWELEWKRFEEVALKLYELQGYKAKATRIGADGGIDIVVYESSTNEPLSLIQCKAWNTRPIGVKPVRELLGVMAHNKIKHGIFMTTGTFTSEATQFARQNNLVLIDGPAFLKEINALGSENQKTLLRFAVSGDYRTPTCPRCDKKMVLREGVGYKGFWGCSNFPRCNQKFNYRAA